MTRIVDQPPPVPSRAAELSVQAMVRADLEERERVGRERYGTPLQPHNGRDALVDAYQEALGLACYLRQAIAEREVVSFTCPRCQRTSHHPMDVQEGYCGACHDFTGEAGRG